MDYYKKTLESGYPAIIKIMIWRITNDFIPTRFNMFKRRLVLDAMCPLCRNRIEDLVHGSVCALF